MKIHLTKELESDVRAEVASGHFASESDLIATALREYFRQRRQTIPSATPEATTSALGSIGAMRDAADDLDEAVEHAMNLRQRPWRLTPGE